MRLVHWLLGVLFPPKCVLCGKILGKEELDLCRTCREEAPEFLNRKRRCQFLDSFAAVWYYEGNVRRSLLRFKFGGARNYAAAYGRLLAMRIQNQYPDGFDVLTWIPVSRLRKLRTSFDIPARSVDLCVLRDVPLTSAAQRFSDFIRESLHRG